MTEAEYLRLKGVLAGGHPVNGAYDPDHAIAVTQINALDVPRDRPTIPSTEILEHIMATPAEWESLTVGQQTMVSMILDQNRSVPTAVDAPARVALIAILGTTQKAAIAAAIPEIVSHATEQGFPVIIIGDVENARTQV